MLPPPAPIVLMSMVGALTGRPQSTSNVVRSSNRSSLMTATSKLVPPMSMVIEFRRPISRPTNCPPSTPPAGPDTQSETGRAAASSLGCNPPSELDS